MFQTVTHPLNFSDEENSMGNMINPVITENTDDLVTQ